MSCAFSHTNIGAIVARFALLIQLVTVYPLILFIIRVCEQSQPACRMCVFVSVPALFAVGWQHDCLLLDAQRDRDCGEVPASHRLQSCRLSRWHECCSVSCSLLFSCAVRSRTMRLRDSQAKPNSHGLHRRQAGRPGGDLGIRCAALNPAAADSSALQCHAGMGIDKKSAFSFAALVN